MKSGLTHHAATRIQQRGIDSQAFECLLAYGSSVHDHRGGEILLFDKRAWKRLERSVDEQTLRRVSESRALYAVQSSDGSLLTVGHRFKRVRRD